MSKVFHLFEVFGLELEYMLVQNKSLKVAPMVDRLLTLKNGTPLDDVDNKEIAWSNELVAHVVELKTNGPTSNLNDLAHQFHINIQEVNTLLSNLQVKLMPTAMHPFMNPKTDTQLWKHSYSEVYELYNRIFNCSGHGWSNVQSTHINLPFFNDIEFEKLHAAVRLILPILPALSASSPIVEGKKSKFKDTRLEFYKTNQKEIPEMAGMVIPEQVFSKNDYNIEIFEPINKAITPFDTEGVLDHYFLNSRGAIARFDRNAIEIRLLDIQECPKADIAICVFIIEVLKWLVNETFVSLEHQKNWEKEPLFSILNDCIVHAEETLITNTDYLKLFGLNNENATANMLWKHLFEIVKSQIHTSHHEAIEVILNQGTLSSRILKATHEDFSEENILKVYHSLAENLNTNTFFVP